MSLIEQDEKNDGIISLCERIQSSIKPGLKPELQGEIARLISMLPDLAKVNDSILECSASIAATSLLCENPNIELAQKIGDGLETRLKIDLENLNANQRKRILKSPIVTVVIGLATFLYCVIPIAIFIITQLPKPETILGVNTEILQLVALSGAMGSIVSILIRLDDFSKAIKTDRAVLFFTGFFKPIVGIAFALFVFSILSSGLIPVVIATEKAKYFFAALSFVSGFSERFAQDVILKTEAAINQTKK